MISILGVSLSSKIQLIQGQIGWNHDLISTTFQFGVFRNSQFFKAEINSQVTTVSLDKN